MAHELTTRANGFVEMAYAGEGCWHGLGQQLEHGASIEEWQTAAGMDWKINRSRVRFGAEDNPQIFDDKHVLFRSDTKAPLGIVSPNFKIVNPKDVLEFFRDLTESAGMVLETAGTIFGGKRFWALANIGESAVIGSADVVGGYLLLSTGADGTIATTAKFTSVRVVCNNTLSMALNGKNKRDIAITHRTAFNPASMKDRLGLAHGEFSVFINAMRDLSKKTVTAKDAEMLTLSLVAPEEKDDKGTAKTIASKPFQNIMALFNGAGKGATLQGSENTAWGWVNAITEHVDHHARAQTADSRMNSAFFGKGDEMKTRAVEIAMAM